MPLATYRAQRRGGKGRSGMSTRDEDFVTRLFVANTHTPVLFFSSRGMVYKMKVWKLPAAQPQSLGKALINLLPLDNDEWITSIMPLPEDEASWDQLHVMFATADGNVRRNKLSEFVEVRQSGKIAMKLDEGQRIIGVDTCAEGEDVLLTTAKGRAIRFPVIAVREFKGRDSRGVFGIRMDDDDAVISMAILRHVKASPEERAAYLKQAGAMRRAASGQEAVAEEEAAPETEVGDDEAVEPGDLLPERYAELSGREQFVLTVSENGYGKRTSAYEYRISGRGGKGIIAMVVNPRNGPLVGAFPVEDSDHIMLVTDRGKLIRCPVEDISITGRATQGVKIFSTGAGERVVSVVHIPEEDSTEEGGDSDAGEG